MPKMKNFGLRLPPEQADRIAALALERNMLESEILREAVAIFLGEHVDDTREKLRELCDRVSALESRLKSHFAPEEPPPQVEVEETIEVFKEADYVRDGFVVCPYCDSLANDWEDESRTTVICHDCGKRFVMT